MAKLGFSSSCHWTFLFLVLLFCSRPIYQSPAEVENQETSTITYAGHLHIPAEEHCQELPTDTVTGDRVSGRQKRQVENKVNPSESNSNRVVRMKRLFDENGNKIKGGSGNDIGNSSGSSSGVNSNTVDKEKGDGRGGTDSGSSNSVSKNDLPESNSPRGSETDHKKSDEGPLPCPRNPCELRTFPCSNGGECRLNATSCGAYCECPPPFNDSTRYDRFCIALSHRVVKLPTTTTTTTESPSTESSASLRPLSDRDCANLGLFVCQHGFCVISTTNDDRDPIFACQCDPGWYGVLCETACNKSCHNSGVCRKRADTDDEYCVCPRPWTGDTCTAKLTQEGTRAVSAGVVVSMVIFFLMVVAASSTIIIYITWCWRLYFTLKLVRHFQDYEDQDGRVFDAIICYVPIRRVMTFVHDVLYPKLEQDMGFNICWQQRNAQQKHVRSVSKTTLRSITNSRRIILVLSTHTMDYDWSQFANFISQHEMMALRKRVIPLIVDNFNIMKYIDPNLKFLLDNITPLRYPGAMTPERIMNRFWEKLRLCMPKKRTRNAVEPGSHQREFLAQGSSEDLAPVASSEDFELAPLGSSEELAPTAPSEEIELVPIASSGDIEPAPIVPTEKLAPLALSEDIELAPIVSSQDTEN